MPNPNKDVVIDEINNFQKEPGYFWVENRMGEGFNRLKGKLFNLVEASIIDKDQCKAIKGLIRDFANAEYKRTSREMRDEAIEAKFIKKDEDNHVPPLEVHGTSFGKLIDED